MRHREFLSLALCGGTWLATQAPAQQDQNGWRFGSSSGLKPLLWIAFPSLHLDRGLGAKRTLRDYLPAQG